MSGSATKKLPLLHVYSALSFRSLPILGNFSEHGVVKLEKPWRAHAFRESEDYVRPSPSEFWQPLFRCRFYSRLAHVPPSPGRLLSVDFRLLLRAKWRMKWQWWLILGPLIDGNRFARN